MKNGYFPPSHLLPDAKNALAGMYYGAGGHRLGPVPKRPGVFRTTVEMGARHALLDDSYSFRVAVVNAEGTRATFQDVAVLR